MEKPQNYLSRLRQRPLLWNLVLIGAIILVMAIAAHILMQLGTRHGSRRTVPDFSGVPLHEAQPINTTCTCISTTRCSSPPTREASSSTSCPKGASR